VPSAASKAICMPAAHLPPSAHRILHPPPTHLLEATPIFALLKVFDKFRFELPVPLGWWVVKE